METKEITALPDYILQHNAISRSIYTMSPNARKAIAMAMAYRDINMALWKKEFPKEELRPEDVLEIEFNINDFFYAFDIEKSTKGVAQLDKVLKEITGLKAGVVQDNGKVEYLVWIQYSCIDFKNKKIIVKFSEDIIKYINQRPKEYHEMLLDDIAQLKSFYAMRWLEIAKSYESLAGKQGNMKDCWYIASKTGVKISRIRQMFEINENEYKRFDNLKKRVFNDPIDEINGADLGITIKAEFVQNRNDKRETEAVILRCRAKARKNKVLEERTIAYKNETGQMVKKRINAPEKIIETNISDKETQKFKKEKKNILEELVKEFHKNDDAEAQKWKEKFPEQWEMIYNKFKAEEKPKFINENTWLNITCVTKTIETLIKMGLTIN